MRRELIPTFIAYGVGTASFLIVDLLLTKALSDEELGDWGLLRSVLFMCSGLALIGMDQAVIRHPIPAHKYIPSIIKQVALLCLPLLWLPYWVKTANSGAAIYLASVSLAIIMGIGGYFQSIFRVAISQFVMHSWRTLFLILVILILAFFGTPYGLDWKLAVVLVIWSLIAMLVAWLHSRTNSAAIINTVDCQEIHINEYADLYKIGLRFWFFALLANAMNYLDQLMLNFDGQKDIAGHYFAYTSIFLPAALFIAGFLGSVLSPYFRQQGNLLRPKLRKFFIGYVSIGIILIGICAVSGMVLGNFTGRFAHGIDWPLVFAVLFIALLRYAYILPSAMLGIFGTAKELDKMLWVSIGSVVFMITVYIGLRWLTHQALIAVVGAMLINLLIRNAYGAWLVYGIVNSGRSLKVEV